MGIANALRAAPGVMRRIVQESDHYGCSTLRSLRRFWHLSHRLRFSPREIFFYGLLSPAIPDERLDFYLSRELQVALEQAVVPRSYHCLTSDKSVFYAYCASLGLAVPRVHAVIDGARGWRADGQAVASEGDLAQLIADLPGPFIVKPALGMTGGAISAFERHGSGFRDHSGAPRGLEDVLSSIAAAAGANAFAQGQWSHGLGLKRPSHKVIIQERLFAHEAIAEITGGNAISTYRIVTLMRDRRPQMLFCAFRAASRGNITDNFARGASGNTWATVDGASGTIRAAHRLDADGTRLTATFGRDGVDGELVDGGLVGTTLPQWGEALALVREAALRFEPQPLIAWDVGISTRGPVLIEGNLGWAATPTPLTCDVRALLRSVGGSPRRRRLRLR